MMATAISIDAMRAEESAAARSREQAHSAVAELQRRRLTLLPLVERNVGGQMDLPTPSMEERLIARAELPGVEAALDDRQLKALRADRRHDDARQAVRDAVRAQIHAQKRAQVRDLRAALLAARIVSEKLARLEDREQDECGGYVDRLSWPQLATSTPTIPSQLDGWLDAVEHAGLD
jgi:hypothetical protein